MDEERGIERMDRLQDITFAGVSLDVWGRVLLDGEVFTC